MRMATATLVGVIALAHLWFLVLEMFLWRTPFGRKTFGTTPEFAQASAALAANQGLYNGFLAAGLIWGLFQGLTGGRAPLTFFLACIVIAGVYGGFTAKRSILFIQALPAAVALILLWLAG
jgi:putative membrane protein